MEFLKYGDCPLELQNLGRAKLMLELSPCTFIEKQSLRSENTDMPGTDSLQHQNKLYFQSQWRLGYVSRFHLSNLWTRPWAEWNTEKFTVVFLPCRSPRSRGEDSVCAMRTTQGTARSEAPSQESYKLYFGGRGRRILFGCSPLQGSLPVFSAWANGSEIAELSAFGKG